MYAYLGDYTGGISTVNEYGLLHLRILRRAPCAIRP